MKSNRITKLYQVISPSKMLNEVAWRTALTVATLVTVVFDTHCHSQLATSARVSPVAGLIVAKVSPLSAATTALMQG